MKIMEEKGIGVIPLGSQHFEGKKGVLKLRDGD
jgi:hypothetical protein